MTDLLAARSQMALSLGFHIIFAVVGMAMPLLMVIAEALWLRTGDAGYRLLAYRWSKGTAVMFAVGAVSGTVLSFELGLLWPEFMNLAGPVIGLPMSLEGFAFFFEAIFLGIYLYGWDRVPRGVHLASGVIVLVCGVASGAFVVTANAWMNHPVGFEWDGQELLSVDPWAVLTSPMALSQVAHMVVAAFLAVGFAVAAIHAWVILRGSTKTFHRRALAIALTVGGVSALLQPLTGHRSGEAVAHYQPIKLAAMEGHFQTEAAAPLKIGGWPDEETRTTRFAINVPYALSILAHSDPHAEVLGLEAFPEEDWPPVLVVHVAFQIMIATGMAMAGVTVIGGLLFLRTRRLPLQRWYLWLVVACGPLGIIGIEAGWTVTEVGRQPWIIHGVMRTAEAVTPMPGLQVPLASFTVLYLVLGFVVVLLLKRLVAEPLEEDDRGS